MSEHREWALQRDNGILFNGIWLGRGGTDCRFVSADFDSAKMATAEHNATVRAYRDAMADAARLGRANDDACDNIYALKATVDDQSAQIKALESRPVLTWEECEEEFYHVCGHFPNSSQGSFMGWLKSRLPAPTDSIRVPFSDAQIERMAKAHMSVISPCANWEHADKQYYMNAQRAALAADGLEPCAVPERASDEELGAIGRKRYADLNRRTPDHYDKYHFEYVAAAIRARVEAPLLAEIGRLKSEDGHQRAIWATMHLRYNVESERDTLKARVAELEAEINDSDSALRRVNDDYFTTRAELEAVTKMRDYFESERSECWRILNDARIGGISPTFKLDFAVKQLAELAALRQRDTVPVKVRWSVTAEEAARMMQNIKCGLLANSEMIYSSWDELGENYKEDFTKTFEKLLPRLAAHAIIDVPAGVPSVEELDKIADEAFSAAAKQSSSAKVRQTAMLTAIRDAVLRGMDAPSVWTDEQIEKLARVMRDSYIGHGHPPIPASGYWLGIARAAVDFMRVGPPVAGVDPDAQKMLDPAPIASPEFKTVTGFEMLWNEAMAEVASPDVLEQLAEIGLAAYYASAPDNCKRKFSEISEACQKDTLDQTAAILRAAQAYVDVTPEEAFAVWQSGGYEHDRLFRVVDLCGSRIRYRVALPETPKGLPSAGELEDIIEDRIGWLREDPDDSGYEAIKVVGFDDAAEAILAALRPWLHEPTGWELDVTPDEAMRAYCETYHEGAQKDWQAVLDLCRSRIRPTFECAECAKNKSERDVMYRDWDDCRNRMLAVRLALNEGSES